MSLWSRVYQERRAVIVPLVIVLVANAAVFGLAVLPLQRSVTTAESTVIDTTLALAEARRAEKQARDAKASKERAETELRKFYADVLPRDINTARKATTAWLQQAVTDAGLTFKSNQLNFADVRDSELKRVIVKFTLQGRYPNIRKFLYAVETAEEFIVVEKVELGQSGSDAPGNAGVLEVQLTVATYFLAGPQ
jgi:Tfp pilus assembly protein PilO